MVLGVFSERIGAENAISALEERGYDPKNMSLMMRDRAEAEALADDTGADLAGGAVSGAVTGGALGALAGLLVATGVLPGLGVLLVGGPIAAALGLTGAAATTVAGATTGALAGGLIGALMSLGLSEDDARIYEERIKEGGILLAVPARIGEEDEVKTLLSDYGADQIRSVSSEETTPAYMREERGFAPAYFSEVSREDGEIVEVEERPKKVRVRKSRK